MTSADSAMITVDLSGPFFEVDPGETFFTNMQRMMEGIATEGAADMRQALLLGSGTRDFVRMTQDRVADHVTSRTSSLAGRQWATAAVIGVDHSGLDALQSISLMAAGSELEGSYHPIEAVGNLLQRASAVLVADLSAGLE